MLRDDFILFCFLDTISLTINTGNSTFPSLNPVNQSESDVVLADQSEHLDVDDLGWEHMRTAFIAIVAGVIAFLTIVGNIMVGTLNLLFILFCLTWDKLTVMFTLQSQCPNQNILQSILTGHH